MKYDNDVVMQVFSTCKYNANRHTYPSENIIVDRFNRER
jgi:hypothetical protein